MFKLALLHLKYNRFLSAILIVCLTIAIFLPMVTWLSSSMLHEEMTARSDGTPLLIGSEGSPFLLTLNSIYFKTDIEEPITLGALNAYRKRCAGLVIPLYTGHTAKKYPVVGTSHDYFSFRGLEPADGTLPVMLGDAVAGAGAARQLRLKKGGSVITDCDNIYDISAEYPLLLRITGILKPTGTPDDNAIFVDVKTAWIMDGIGHGHEDAVAAPDNVHDESILFIEANEVKYNSRLKKYNEVTRRNIDNFHFHGDADDFPLSALIVVPDSHKEKVLVMSETNLSTDRSANGAEIPAGLQAIAPTDIISEILALIFDIKKILDSFSGLVLVSTGAFLFLVLSLLFRLRRDEMEIIFRIGGSRHAMEMMLGIETAILLGASFVVAGLLSLIVTALARSYYFT